MPPKCSHKAEEHCDQGMLTSSLSPSVQLWFLLQSTSSMIRIVSIDFLRYCPSVWNPFIVPHVRKPSGEIKGPLWDGLLCTPGTCILASGVHLTLHLQQVPSAYPVLHGTGQGPGCVVCSLKRWGFWMNSLPGQEWNGKTRAKGLEAPKNKGLTLLLSRSRPPNP